MDAQPTIGPFTHQLIMRRASQLIAQRAEKIPGEFGTTCGVAARIAGGHLSADYKEAMEWVKQALQLIRTAPDTEWHTDEEAAEEVLRRIDVRRNK